MGYPDAAWERAMMVQEVMLKAVSGEPSSRHPWVVTADAAALAGAV